MSDEISPTRTPRTKTPKSGKKLFAMLAAGLVLLAGGITVTSVGVANAKETDRLCIVALEHSASATKSAQASIEKADKALETVKSTALPGSAGEGGAGTSTAGASTAGESTAWTSTEYAERPAVAATTASRAFRT